MATKPTKEELISYLYGELSEVEHKNIEKWLQKNPDTLREVEELKAIQTVMGHVKDEEVLDPFFYSTKGRPTIWQVSRIIGNTIIKPAIGLAAAISFLVLIGYITGLNINDKEGYLSINFKGNSADQVQQIDEQKVASIVKEVLGQEDLFMSSDAKELEDGLKAQLVSYFDEQNNKYQNSINADTQSDTEAFAGLVRQMQEDNLEYLERYLEMSNRNQEQYVQATLTEFSEFLAEQREKDLGRIQYNLTTLKETQDIQKMETDQILATIMNTVNNENNN